MSDILVISELGRILSGEYWMGELRPEREKASGFPVAYPSMSCRASIASPFRRKDGSGSAGNISICTDYAGKMWYLRSLFQSLHEIHRHHRDRKATRYSLEVFHVKICSRHQPWEGQLNVHPREITLLVFQEVP